MKTTLQHVADVDWPRLWQEQQFEMLQMWKSASQSDTLAWPVVQWMSQAITVLTTLSLALLLPYLACRGVPQDCLPKARETTGMTMVTQLVLAMTMLLDYSCTDQYQPNMPDIAKDLKVSPTAMGSTIQVHLLSCALGILVVGPLSDQIGRRPVILICQVMQAISTFTCMCATNLAWFMAGRVIQGLAASVYVVILASMRDCFDDPASRQQAMGRMLFLMQIGPIFAPVVGGFLASAFGWRFPFGLLALLAVLAACVSWQVFHETASARPQCNNLAGDIYHILSSHRRLSILACVGTTKSMFDLVISTNAFILQDRFGQTVKQTSVYTAAFAVAVALGSVVASRLHVEPASVLRMFMPLLLFAALVLVLAGIHSDSIIWYLSSISFLQFVVFPPIIAYHAEFTRDLRELAGAATSVDLSSQYMLSSLVSMAGLSLSQGSTSSLLFVLAGTVLVTELITATGIHPK